LGPNLIITDHQKHLMGYDTIHILPFMSQYTF